MNCDKHCKPCFLFAVSPLLAASQAHPSFVMQNTAGGFNPYLPNLGGMAGVLPATAATLDSTGASVPVSAGGATTNHLTTAGPGMMTASGLAGPQTHKLSRVDRLEVYLLYT